MDDILTWGLMVDELQSEGYTTGTVPSSDCWADRDIVEGERCERCGLRKVFVPFWRRDPRSYRAFSACPACDTAHEF